MAPNDLSRVLRSLREYAAGEQDPAKLVKLIREINRLLDIIETRLAALQRDINSSSN
jgi:hypothetical protein